MLPSKTIPEVKNKKQHMLKHKTLKLTSAHTAPLRKKVRLTPSTDVEGKDGPHAEQSSASGSTFQVSYESHSVSVNMKVRFIS